MSMKPATRLLLLAAITIGGVIAASPASAYAVICRSGQWDVDSRDDAQLRMAFGTSFCTIRRFSFRSHAEDFARNNGMTPGRACSCR